MKDAVKKIEALAKRFNEHENALRSPSRCYSESEARSEYIDPFFAALGWDMVNAEGKPNGLKDVVREESQESDATTTRPDYTFRVAAERKFFVEAKKPSVDIRTNRSSASQVRGYGLTAGHPIAVLTNFDTLSIYDCSHAPDEKDSADVALLHRYHYTEYVDKFEEISSLLGRTAVGRGSIESFGKKRPDDGKERVSAAFVERFDSWRKKIALDLIRIDPNLNDFELNDITQRVINRMVFVRMCEDRGIEGKKSLLEIAEKKDECSLRDFFKRLDDRYNTGLFDTEKDPLQEKLRISSETFLDIVSDLYFPKSPYNYGVLDADFFGQVYERFLENHVTKSPEGGVAIEKKPDYRNREVVTTPQPMVNELVRRAFLDNRKGQERTYGEVLNLRVLDIAAGSGRFLLKAFDALVDEAITAIKAAGETEKLTTVSEGDYRLPFEMKKQILSNCLYGIDIDFNAVEVARFSLLVKLLEDERAGSLPVEKRKILPNTDKNVVFGNSVVGKDFSATDERAMEKTAPFEWKDGLPASFDIVVGNPPYIKTEEMLATNADEYRYFAKTYKSAFKQFDKYFVFLEQAIIKTKDGGTIGMVVPNKFFTAGSGEKIRSIIHDKARPSSIVDFGNDTPFAKKMAYVCLLVLKKGGEQPFSYSQPDEYSHWVLDPQEKGGCLPASSIDASGKAWVLTEKTSERRILESLRTNSVPLKGIATVFNGLQTSAEKIYAIKPYDDSEGLISFSDKNGLRWTIEKAATRPYLTDSKSRVSSYCEVQADALIIYPYDEKGHFLNPDVMRKRFPQTLLYLEHYKDELSRRNISPKSDDAPFYRYGRQQATVTAFLPRKILYSANQRGDKYGIDRSGIGFASGGTAGEVAICNPKNGYSLEFLLALLHQEAAETFFKGRGSKFRGGYVSRGSNVMNDLPVPLLDFSDPTDAAFHKHVTETTVVLIEKKSRLRSAHGRARERLEQECAHLMQSIKGSFDAHWKAPHTDSPS